jgi:hypothetical protein
MLDWEELQEKAGEFKNTKAYMTLPSGMSMDVKIFIYL